MDKAGPGTDRASEKTSRKSGGLQRKLSVEERLAALEAKAGLSAMIDVEA